MKIHRILPAAMLFVATNAGAQAYLPSGNIKDTKGNAVAYASVALLKTDTVTLAGGTMSGSAGEFAFEGVPDGEYVVSVSLIGYKPCKKLVRLSAGAAKGLDIVLEEKDMALGTVTVKGNRGNTVRRSASGQTFMLSAAAAGKKDAYSALQEIPVLQIDPDTRKITLNNGGQPLVLINGISPENKGFFEESISVETWRQHEDAPEQTGSFFYARYTGDERFFEQESSRVHLGIPSVEFEISGKDADYEYGFPVNVPARPAWVDPIDEACRSLLPLTHGKPETSVTVYQEGYRDYARMERGQSGVLGELSPFDNVDAAGNWLIVDWVSLSKGVYVSSDEAGVRLSAGDATLRVTDGSYTLDELVECDRLDERESRTYLPETFETYRIETRSGYFASLPAHIRNKGWFSVSIAYDNKDPETGLEELGIEAEALVPSLYTVKVNPDAEDSEDEPPLEVGIMRAETLKNGFQYTSTALFEDEQLMLARA